jgi:hypothetical protein
MEAQIKLGFEEITNEDATIKGILYADGTVGNPYFTGAELIAQGVLVRNDTVDLGKALQKPISPTRASNIQIARNTWEKDVRLLTQMQQIVVSAADVSDEEKIKMIKSANREVVQHTNRQKFTFTAKRGPNSGEVVFTAETSDAVAHLFTYTTDLISFKSKADPWESASAKTTATGIPKGELAFFHKGIFTKKRMDWEGPVFLTVL